jgi:hypothetical protein
LGNPVFDVKTFQAIGDGVADDTSAIANTLTAAAAGGLVFFPNGTYITSGTVVTNPNVTIWLSSGATLKLKAASNGPVLQVNASGIKVRGGTVDGNQANQTSTIQTEGIVCRCPASTTVQWIAIEDCVVQNTVNAGIKLDSTTNAGALIQRCAIRNNVVSNVGAAAVAAVAEGIALYGATDCAAAGNAVVQTANHGIISTRGNKNRLIGNHIVNAGQNFNNGFAHGIGVDGNGGSNANSDHVVGQNMILSSKHAGIEVADGVNNVTIHGNTVDTTGAFSGTGSDLSGIYYGGALALSSFATITGNTVLTAATHGIQIDSPSSSNRTGSVTVSGNVVNACQNAGILVTFGTEINVNGNTVQGCSLSGASAYSGIQLTSTQNCMAVGNRSQGANHAYGVRFLTAVAGVAVADGNSVAGNVNAGIPAITGLTLGTNVG